MSRVPPWNGEGRGPPEREPGIDANSSAGSLRATHRPRPSSWPPFTIAPTGWCKTRLAGPSDRHPAALDRLIHAYRRDDLQIQAALLSASTSFLATCWTCPSRAKSRTTRTT